MNKKQKIETKLTNPKYIFYKGKSYWLFEASNYDKRLATGIDISLDLIKKNADEKKVFNMLNKIFNLIEN